CDDGTGPVPPSPRRAVDDDPIPAKGIDDDTVTVHVIRTLPVFTAARVLVDLELRPRLVGWTFWLLEPADPPFPGGHGVQRDREVLEVQRPGVAQIPESARVRGGARVPNREPDLDDAAVPEECEAAGELRVRAACRVPKAT